MERANSVVQIAFDDVRAMQPCSESVFHDALPRLAESLVDRADELRGLMRDETGMTAIACRDEVERGLRSVHACGRIRRASSQLVTEEIPGRSLEIRQVPLGVVGVITPFNHPLNIPLQTILPALAAGNRVVWKGAHQCPASSQLLFEILRARDLPVVYAGSSVEAGRELCASDLDGIVFVGSVPTGRDVAARAGVKKLGLSGFPNGILGPFGVFRG